jgi:hypothetical protein
VRGGGREGWKTTPENSTSLLLLRAGWKGPSQLYCLAVWLRAAEARLCPCRGSNTAGKGMKDARPEEGFPPPRPRLTSKSRAPWGAENFSESGEGKATAGDRLG